MRGEAALGAGLSAVLLLAIPTTVVPTPSEAVPVWAYISLKRLANAGYVILPDKLWTLDRTQFAQSVSDALTNMAAGKKVLTDEASKAAENDAADVERDAGMAARVSELAESAASMGIYALSSDPHVSRRMEYEAATLALKRAEGWHADMEARLAALREQMETADKKLLPTADREKIAEDVVREEGEVRRNLRDMERLRMRQAYLTRMMEEEEGAKPEKSRKPAPAGGSSAGAFEGKGSSRANVVSPPASEVTAEEKEQGELLRAEFAKELAALGYFDDERAQAMSVSTMPPGKGSDNMRFKLDGALRYDYGKHTGPLGIGSRSRLRLRLYPDLNLDNNWHLLGMAEWEKTLHGPKGNEDNRFQLDRYYLEGYSGITLLDLGAFSSNMAEGNIYDTKFTGVRAVVGDPVTYTFEAGTTPGSHRVYNAQFSFRTQDKQRLEGGLYYFDPVYEGARRRIFVLNYRRPVGMFDVGLMYLAGQGDRDMASGRGFVWTLSCGQEDSWRPGAQMGYLKYYHQPRATYAAHTMNGMADYMDGFRGWGVGYSYTLKKDWLLSVEMDRLQDLRTHEYNNTIWVALTYYFKSYKD
ncbi:MAG: hypothetical protein ACTTJE_05825 [Schwartzia sp. (in: firmicutes)]